MKTYVMLVIVLLCLLLTVSPQAYQISAVRVFNATAVVASATVTSSAVDLRNITNLGALALHYTIAGSGTATLSFATSSTFDGTYVTYATAITTGKTAGTYYTPFGVPVTPWIKIIATETGAAQAITITARLVVQ